MKRLVIGVLVFAAARSDAQECPVVNGIVASVTTRDSAAVPAGAASRTAPGAPRDTLLRLDSRTVIDTTWRLDISERRLSRPYVAASVGAGWADDQRLRGTTTAPGSRSWSACVSAAVGMRDPTLVLRGVRGLVRLRADLTPLAGLRRGVRADSSQRR